MNASVGRSDARGRLCLSWVVRHRYMLMKKLAFIGLAVFLLVVSIFLWRHHRNDAEVRENLSGAWHADFSHTSDSGSKSTFTIATNGDFVCEGVDSKGIPLNRLAGTIKIVNGFLIETVTNTTQPNTSVPYVFQARIIHADEKEMVYRFEGARADSILRKDMP